MKIRRVSEEAVKSLDFQSKMVEKAWNAASKAAMSEGLVASGGSLEDSLVETNEEGSLVGLTAAGASYMEAETFVLGAEFEIPVLIPEEIESGDGRTFKRGAISVVDGPLPLLWQQFGQKGHDGSMIVGRIDSLERLDPSEEDEFSEPVEVEGVRYGWGRARGTFDVGPYGREAERLVRGEYLTKISADMDQFEAKNEGAEEAAETEDDGIIKNDKMTISKARLIAATLVSKPAFQEASIFIREPEIEYVELPVEDGVYEEEYEDVFAQNAAMVASAAPDVPPRSWFDNPRLNGPTPLTVEDDGRVYGYIALWETSHIGLPRSTKPPRSRSNYAYFRTGVVRTDDGSDVPVGQLTLAGGHAGLSASAEEAVKHYDDTASAVADVAAGEDAYGIWVAGALRPEVTGSQVRALRASAPSGDWRPINGRLELVAVCQVNVPGFPTARSMVASGKITALVAAGARPLAEMREKSLDERLSELEAATFSTQAAPFLSELEDFVKEEKEALAASAKPAIDFLEELAKADKEERAAQVAALSAFLDELE